MSEEEIDVFQEAKQMSDELRESLPSGFDISDVSPTAKIPFKASSWEGALLHRASVLADNACEAYESDEFVPSCILARSLMETAGMIFWLDHRVAAVIESGELKDINTFLMRGSVGQREGLDGEGDKFEALSALTGIDHTVEEYDGFREMYDGLSEFAHPNWSGTMGAYGYNDKENMSVKFGRDIRDTPWHFIPAPIAVSLLVVREKRRAFNDNFRDFVRICEDDLQDNT